MTSTKPKHESTEARGRARRHWSVRSAKAGLLASVAIAALLAGSATFYYAEARTGDPLFSPETRAAARVPAQPAVIPGFADLVAAVKPAVVSVRVKAREDAQTAELPDNVNPFKGTPFEKFFKDFPDQNNGRATPPFGSRQSRHFIRGMGSGFFISSDGYIVTNNHVVDHAVDVEVVTDKGTTLKAKVIGTDPKTDLALIKVDGSTAFPYVKLAKEQPKIGEWVVAMGNPFGLGGTVTAGIVSAEGRDIGSGPYDDFIQIDAPVNRGNSGGPTFNLNGEVIGVNTAIFSPSGGSVGIAFDIPASTVESVIPQLQRRGYVSRGWLGVMVQPVTKDIAEGLGLKTAKGALVSEPQPDSPAARAGLKSGDVIAKLNGTEVKDARDLARKIAALGPDRPVRLGIVRNGHEQTMKLTLAQLKNKKTELASRGNRGNDQVGRLGMTVAPAGEVEGAGDKGLAVIDVDPDGKAAEAGLQPGDVILKAGDKAISNPDELTAALADAKAAGHSKALVLIKRNSSEHFVAVPVAVG